MLGDKMKIDHKLDEYGYYTDYASVDSLVDVVEHIFLRL